jgi:short-subunit dehydrogenase
MQLKKLSEQVMVITGASSGIGRATAKMAAQSGARVVLTARSAPELANVVAEIREAGGSASFREADITRADQVEAVADHAEREYGRIDTWVNNAGVSAYGPIERLGLEDMRRVMDVTFWGVVNGTRTALPRLRKAGGGALINIGSEVSTAAIPLQGPYVAAKHAVAGFTDVLRLELEKARAPISVTLIRPGSIDTPFFRHAQSVTGREPAPPPPVYAPEMVAEVILHCSSHAERDVVVGGAARALISLANTAPRLADKLFEGTMFRAQQYGILQRDPEGSLYKPSDSATVRGGYHGRRRSLYTTARLHPWASLLSGVVLAAGLAAVTRLGR